MSEPSTAPEIYTNSKGWAKPLLIALIIVGIVALLYAAFQLRPDTVRVNNKTIYIEQVSSTKDLRQGLSGRPSLATDQGMLFDFGRPQKPCMWMKDMKFAIDIVWIDSTKKVVDVKTNVSPETYPNSFCSKNRARYVLELRAGSAANYGIAEGTSVTF